MQSFSKIVDSLRFPFIVMVVFIHCSGTYPVNIDSITWNDTASIDYYVILRFLVIDILCRIAVPSFFLFSGYYFFYKVDSFSIDIYKNKLRKRVRSLLIPYLIWNSLQFVLSALLVAKQNLFNGNIQDSVVGVYNDLGGIVGIFWNGSVSSDRLNWLGLIDGRTAPADMPLWFLRDLIIMSIIAPVIYYSIRKFKIGYLFLLFLLCVFKLWPWIPGLSIDALLYFSIGAYLSINKVDVLALCNKYKIALYCISILLIPILLYMHNSGPVLLLPFYILAAMGSSFNIMITISKKCPSLQYRLINLKQSVFFIYAIHYMSIVAFVPLIADRYICSLNIIFQVFLFFICPILCTLLCLFYFKISSTFFKSTTNVLIGKR